MVQTPYCFLTGLLNTIAIDWSGHGPTCRKWRVDGASLHRHGLGQLVGFLIALGFIIGATVLGMTGHTILGVATSLTLLVCMTAANVIAARLP